MRTTPFGNGPLASAAHDAMVEEGKALRPGDLSGTDSNRLDAQKDGSPERRRIRWIGSDTLLLVPARPTGCAQAASWGGHNQDATVPPELAERLDNFMRQLGGAGRSAQILESSVYVSCTG